MKTEQTLLKMKKEIESAKTKKERLEGQLEAIMNSIKDKYNCKTLKQAQKKLDKWYEDLTKLQEEHEQNVQQLEKEFNERKG